MGILEAVKGAPPWCRWLLAILPLRVALAAAIPVLPEEAYHWNYARHLDWGYYDHPPMIAWAIAAGRLLFGDTAFGVRALTLLFAIGTTALVARMARRFYGDRGATWTVILLTFAPVPLLVSEAGFPDSPLLFFWALAMTLGWRAIEGSNGRRWVAAGAALGAAMLSKYTAAFLVVSVFLYLIFSPRDRRWLRTPWPYVAGIVALAVFTPVIYWNWRHDWASFLYQTKGRFDEARGTAGRPLRFVLSQALGLVPLTLPLAIAALGRIVRSKRPEERFLLACAAPIVLGFWLVSWSRPAHILWPLPGYLALAVAMSGSVAEGVGGVGQWYARGRTALVGVSAVILLGAGVHLAWFLPWISPVQGPYGWREVADRARSLRSTLPDSAFYLALGRKYACASQLAYHLNRPYDVHGDNLIGESALQYEFWSDPAALRGRDALVVIEGQERARLLEPIVRGYFEALEPAGEVVVSVGRSPIRRTPPLSFYFYRARGFHPSGRELREGRGTPAPFGALGPRRRFSWAYPPSARSRPRSNSCSPVPRLTARREGTIRT